MVSYASFKFLQKGFLKHFIIVITSFLCFKLKKQDLIGFQSFLLKNKRSIRSQRFMNIELIIAFHYIYPQIFVIYFLTSDIYSSIHPHPI
jgi:hypothetical protein